MQMLQAIMMVVPAAAIKRLVIQKNAPKMIHL
jgi:hypothetical protein